ncbi:hypothetical protein DPM13_12435 [Paracoccus mutanolyticus]|uniref:Uncharacterized protein n=1 Tax=Paracoccus mutanolyticus TaxID=1499308 RepID=A0ABM6WT26_9RHOB|nr:hypothetical protein DPM13_12435 [Paracoccus mutanolyticus]
MHQGFETDVSGFTRRELIGAFDTMPRQLQRAARYVLDHPDAVATGRGCGARCRHRPAGTGWGQPGRGLSGPRRRAPPGPRRTDASRTALMMVRLEGMPNFERSAAPAAPRDAAKPDRGGL